MFLYQNSFVVTSLSQSSIAKRIGGAFLASPSGLAYLVFDLFFSDTLPLRKGNPKKIDVRALVERREDIRKQRALPPGGPEPARIEAAGGEPRIDHAQGAYSAIAEDEVLKSLVVKAEGVGGQ